MEPESIPKTAFVTPDGHFEYVRMPFGVANGPAVFQKTINKVLGNMRYGKALAYMDDVLLPAQSFQTGIDNLEDVLKALSYSGITLRLSKCHFFMSKIEYLGHKISRDGVQPGKRNTDSVSKFLVPTDVHIVRQFLGLSSYFMKYIKDFATIARSLTTLTKEGTTFNWSSEQQAAFNTLKEKLISRPILAIYDSELLTEVHCDTSKWGVGGILLQK